MVKHKLKYKELWFVFQLNSASGDETYKALNYNFLISCCIQTKLMSKPGLEKLLVFALIAITNTITTLNFNYNYSSSSNSITISITIIYNKKILKTLQLIHLHTKSQVLLMSIQWICFVFLSQTNQSPISLYPCSSINLCLTLIFATHNFVYKQLSSMLLNSYRFQQYSIMVLAKPWYHTAIICAKENKF